MQCQCSWQYAKPLSQIVTAHEKGLLATRIHKTRRTSLFSTDYAFQISSTTSSEWREQTLNVSVSGQSLTHLQNLRIPHAHEKATKPQIGLASTTWHQKQPKMWRWLQANQKLFMPFELLNRTTLHLQLEKHSTNVKLWAQNSHKDWVCRSAALLYKALYMPTKSSTPATCLTLIHLSRKLCKSITWITFNNLHTVDADCFAS